ncbi:hypothetical protein FEE59_13790 [Herbaspirillum sp. RU 5E]|nr:hypothetical protein [Herbaspirillum sp. RU 5E]
MSDSVETVKVKPWSQDQGDFVLINKDDFNPEVHELLDAPAGGSTKADLQAQLTAKGVDFPSNATKADLQALLDKANAPAQ